MATTKPKATNWGRWGEDDERGTLNLVDSASVLAALRIPGAGRVFQLGLPIQREGVPNLDYRAPAQRLTMINHEDEKVYDSFGGEPGVGCAEDLLLLPSHSLTHVDALCHVYDEGTIYNGFEGEAISPLYGSGRCGIEHSGGIVCRGVLIDVAAEQGVDWLDGGHTIGVEELEAALAAQGTELHPGDAVMIRTGWLEWFAGHPGETMEGQPGLGLEGARWLADRDPALIGADNTGVEPHPFPPEEFIPVHRELLHRRGILMAEHMVLAELAAAGVHEFLFIASPLRITGATGSPFNPIAIS
jgi:kynurenine formamidase